MTERYPLAAAHIGIDVLDASPSGSMGRLVGGVAGRRCYVNIPVRART
jgi:hypothetical protein